MARDGTAKAKGYTRAMGVWTILKILVFRREYQYLALVLVFSIRREYKECWYEISAFEAEKIVKGHVNHDEKSELYSIAIQQNRNGINNLVFLKYCSGSH